MHASHCRNLAQCLRNSHPFVFAPRRRGSILGSGLMVLLRFPARRGEFVPMRRGRRFRILRVKLAAYTWR